MYETQIITIGSQKGGVGKTTTSVSLAAALAELDPVALCDFDPQAHVGFSFGLPAQSGVYDWLQVEHNFAMCLERGRPVGLRLLTGNSRTLSLEVKFSDPFAFAQLKERIRALKQENRLKWILIDTAAGGMLQQAAFACSDQIIVPFRPEPLGVDGVNASLAVIQEIAPNAVLTILPVAFDARLREHRINLDQMHRQWGEENFSLPIVTRIAVAEATAYGRTIWEWPHKSLDEVRRGYTVLATRVIAISERQSPIVYKPVLTETEVD